MVKWIIEISDSSYHSLPLMKNRNPLSSALSLASPSSSVMVSPSYLNKKDPPLMCFVVYTHLPKREQDEMKGTHYTYIFSFTSGDYRGYDWLLCCLLISLLICLFVF